MKIIFLFTVLIGLTFGANAQISTNQPSRLKTKVISYQGKIGSGVNGSVVSFVPNAPGTAGSDTVKTAGYESELEWTFVGRNGDKDVYRFTFTRMTKAGSPDKTISSREVQFDGKQAIVFEDDLHCVVIESPTKQDLQSAQKH